MKKIGIIGGLGPESTLMYYREIINLCRQRPEDKIPEIIIYSVDLDEIREYFDSCDLFALTNVLSDKIEKLVEAGASFVAIASNSPHVVFNELQEKAGVPMISIVNEAARYCRNVSENGRVGLLGTGFTMKSEFFPKIFKQYGLKIFLPDTEEQEFINEKIYSELSKGIISDETRIRFEEITKNLVTKYSIDSLALGCTELPLILRYPLYGLHYVNTVSVHVQSIVDYCFSDN